VILPKGARGHDRHCARLGRFPGRVTVPLPAPGRFHAPNCGTTSGVRQTNDTGRIQAWACDRCDTDWAFTVPDSHTAALLGDLGAAVQEIGRLRWKLAQVIAVPTTQPSWPMSSCGPGCWYWPTWQGWCSPSKARYRVGYLFELELPARVVERLHYPAGG
jgi:hypothetical protein